MVYSHDETVNAYAAGDGTIGFYGGFIRMTGNDDELAAVMAHEVAHILYGHNQASGTNEVLGGLVGLAAGVAIMAGTGVYNEGMQDMTQSFTEAGMAAGRVAYSPEIFEGCNSETDPSRRPFTRKRHHVVGNRHFPTVGP